MATGQFAAQYCRLAAVPKAPNTPNTKCIPSSSTGLPRVHSGTKILKSWRIPSEHFSALSRCHTPSKCVALAGSVGLKDARSLPGGGEMPALGKHVPRGQILRMCAPHSANSVQKVKLLG